MSTTIADPLQEDKWLSRVARWDDREADQEIRQGVSVDLVEHLQQLLDLSDEQTAHIIGRSRSTYSRYRKQKKELEVPEAERAVRYAQLLALAGETFGSLGEAQTWMREPNRGLGDETPMKVAETNPGTEIVRNLLLGLQHGFPL